MATNNIDTSEFISFGCDGTSVNICTRGGVMKLLEEHLGRPLQWLVCQLYANKLLLRYLFQYFDGNATTSGFCSN
jgi:hypothetical protein